MSSFFNGWDWRELATAWNIYIPDSYAGRDLYLLVKKQKEDPKPSRFVTKLDELFDNYDSWVEPVYEDFDETDPLIWYIDIVLRRAQGNSTRVMKKMAKDVRDYLNKLAKSNYTYYTPLWRGLAKIKDDWSLLIVISGRGPLLSFMWD